MTNSYFVIPDTGTIVYNGDTVILSEYPDLLAIAAYGWYRYKQSSRQGWHFVLLSNGEVIPAADVNLSLITVASSEHGSTPPCPPVPPPGPGPGKFSDRTFITLDTIAQRDKLSSPFMPNGRIVRVNDKGDGEPGYYQWDVATETWLPWDVTSGVPEGSIRLEFEDIVTSVDSTKYTDSYIRHIFRAGSPLSEALGVTENTLCELYFYEIYQVIVAIPTQKSFVRQIYQTSPQWVASAWFVSETQQRLEEAEKAIDMWKQNDILENRLTGAPNLTEEELNALLEARLNGETRSD